MTVPVPVAEVLGEGPSGDEETGEEHPPPSVTVTVAVATLTVDTTVVVAAQDVTVDARHCELVKDSVSESIAVPPVPPEVEDGSGPFVPLEVAEGPATPEDVGELVMVVMPDCPKPHSSKLCPFSAVSWEDHRDNGCTYVLATPHLSSKLLPGAVVAVFTGTC